MQFQKCPMLKVLLMNIFYDPKLAWPHIFHIFTLALIFNINILLILILIFNIQYFDVWKMFTWEWVFLEQNLPHVKYPSKDTCKNYIFVGEKLDIAC